MTESKYSAVSYLLVTCNVSMSKARKKMLEFSAGVPTNKKTSDFLAFDSRTGSFYIITVACYGLKYRWVRTLINSLYESTSAQSFLSLLTKLLF